MKRAISIALCALALACGGAHLAPRSLTDLDATRTGAAAEEAKRLAPQTFGEAEAIYAQAKKASDDGDDALANILAERASAAYQRAFAQARQARATQALDASRGALASAQAEQAKTADELARVTAEVSDLETRIKVARDQMPIFPSGPTDPIREAARLDASRALLTEARVLCTAAKLLSADPKVLGPADDAVKAVQTTLDAKDKDKKTQAPIDAAARARAGCLDALTQARKAAHAKATDDASDTLLADLSKDGSMRPVRDDRGVVVTVPHAFAGGALTKDAEARFSALGKVSAAHAAMPLLVVIHDDAARDASKDGDRTSAAKKALANDKADVVFAGTTRPLVDPKSKDKAQNDRVEIVFVDTGA